MLAVCCYYIQFAIIHLWVLVKTNDQLYNYKSRKTFASKVQVWAAEIIN